MKRFIKLKSGFLEKKSIDGSMSIQFEIHYEEVSSLFMELQMLKFHHSNSLTLQSSQKSNSLLIQYVQKTSSARVENGKYYIELSEKEIGFLCSFLLQYYRDFTAPVDHIDIELASGKDKRKEESVYLVVKTSDFENCILS